MEEAGSLRPRGKGATVSVHGKEIENLQGGSSAEEPREGNPLKNL
jgi:hypothetical protein